VSRPGARGFDLWENRASIFLLLVMCGILVVVSSIASFFHLHRRRHILAVGNGLFVVLYSVLLQDLADVIFVGSRVDTIAAYLSMFLYIAVLMYWIAALWEPEKDSPPPSAKMKAQVVALHEQVQYDLNKVNGPRQ
jgi:drug/metabolite transporter (DMT)-like permease